MKTTIALIIVAIIGTCIFTGCIGTAGTMILGGIQSHPEEGWSHTAYLEKLMNYPQKKLLSEDEKLRAAKNICALKHLDKRKKINYQEAKAFCTLKQNDKIYFYDNCQGCSSAVNSEGTSYLLVRNGKPFEAVQIERKYSKELGRSVPIVDRLH
jgi:hypothetical protein